MTKFRSLLAESTQTLNILFKKIGNCINKVRPYYELVKEARKVSNVNIAVIWHLDNVRWSPLCNEFTRFSCFVWNKHCNGLGLIIAKELFKWLSWSIKSYVRTCVFTEDPTTGVPCQSIDFACILIVSIRKLIAFIMPKDVRLFPNYGLS